MRKTPALLGLAFLSSTLVTAPHASAHPEHGVFVEWRSPEDGQRVSGREVPVRAKVAFGDDGVKSWAVEVLAPPGADHPGFGTICEESVGAAATYVEIDCVWDTTAYPDDGGLSANRPYVVRISAENGQRGMFSPPPERHTAERNVVVVNPVSTPRDVNLSFSEAGRQVTVSWAANPEPDVTGYVVQERFGSRAWRTVGEAGGKSTRFIRRLSTPGTYRYQVAARRSAGSPDDHLQSAFAGPADEPREIVVPEPKRPAPTTSTTRPGGKAPERDPGPGPGPGLSPEPPGDDPGVPAPVASGGSVSEDPAAAGEAGAEGEAAPAGRPGNRPAAGLVTRIQPGTPGSVGSQEVFSGKLVDKQPPSVRTTAPEPDGPFSETLPYPEPEPPAVEEDEGLERVLVGLPSVIADDDRRALVAPLAAGLLLFVFAMHAFYLSRRSAEAPLETE